MADKRIFIAIDIPADWQTELVRLQKTIKQKFPETRLTSENNFHITLCFIGETPEENIPELIDKLSGYLSGLTRLNIQPTDFGMFYHRGRSVFWQGVSNPGLESIGTALIPFGQDKTEQNFRPHITVGRLNGKKLDPQKINFKTNLSAFTAKQIILYEAKPSSAGPVYKNIFVWDLN